MDVVSSPNEPMQIPVSSHEEMDVMPVGTLIGEPPAAHGWEKHADNRWHRYDIGDTRGSSTRDFGIGTLRYTGILGVNR
jgi:hypothetical protein